MDIENKINRFKSYDDIAKVAGFVEGLPFEKSSYKNLLGGYRLNPKVMCCFLREGRICHTPHNRGFVVELMSGEVTIVGKECVRKLGTDEKLLQDVKVLEKEEKRQDKIKSLKDRLKSPLITYEEVDSTYNKVLDIEKEIDGFLYSMPSEVSQYLLDKVRAENNAITVSLTYEREYYEKNKRKVETSSQRTVVYRIKGLRFLNYELLKPIKKRLSSVKGAVKAVDSINNNTPLKKINDIASELNAYQRQLKNIDEFKKYKTEFMGNDFRFFILLASLLDDGRELYSALKPYSKDIDKLGGKAVHDRVEESILNHSGAVSLYMLDF